MLEAVGVDRCDPETLERAVGAHEVAHHRRCRATQDLRRRCVLLEHAADLEDRDAIAHLHGFLDVVRDEHHRLLHLALEAQELVLQADARHRIDRTERFVHQEHWRVGGQRARDPDSLALAARELRGIAPPIHRRVESDQVEQLVDPRGHAVLPPSEQARHGRHVGADVLVREQPHLLDHVAHATPQLDRVGVGDVGTLEEDAPRRGLDQPVDHLQRGGLPASGRTDEHADLTSRDVDRELANGHLTVRVLLAHPIEADHGREAGSDPRTIPAAYHLAMGALLLAVEDIGPKWLYWPWVSDHTDEIRARLSEHIELTVLAVTFGLVIALPLALLSVRYRRLYGPVLAITGVLYTIPSLALFAMLLPLSGLSRVTALVPLTAYTLLILVRNTVIGLDGVPEDVKDAATGMGYSRRRRLLRVELPLALPAIIAGIRIATVTTIGLVAVAAAVGQGGLGALMFDGLQRAFRTPLTVGIVLSLALAIVADLLLVGAQRLATPWNRKESRRRRAASGQAA